MAPTAARRALACPFWFAFSSPLPPFFSLGSLGDQRLFLCTPFAYTAPVRKRLVIGAIAVVVIGVAAWVFWEPGKGTLEWHKREYLEELARARSRSWVERIPVPGIVRQWYWDRRSERRKFHQEELIRLDFLEAKQIDVKNTLGGQLNGILESGRAMKLTASCVSAWF